ncbi:hypothetical protein O181_017835 [Austropuccinia psidii MF-1]|uniref:Uncharacterized protein n=1 Tax=Austropuccinia psidii MF-1 TaxID=1389203 RepID=A0A9Q3GTE9_9BASI|nr:hypothetical protein [Austropuccinia psidii MF-1]
MSQRSRPRRTARCTCTSHGCIQQQCLYENGQPRPGLIITTWQCHLHMLADQRILNVEAHACNDPQDNEHPHPVVEPPLIETSSPDHSRPNHPNDDPEDPPYDCSPYHIFNLQRANPPLLHISLIAVLLHVFEHCSSPTCSSFLKANLDLVKIILTQGLVQSQPHRMLTHAENTSLHALPLDICTIMKSLHLDPVLNYLVCCSECYAMYPINSNIPLNCVHLTVAHADDGPDPTDEIDDNHPVITNQICGTLLFSAAQNKMVPLRHYATQHLFEWLARFFAQPNIENELERCAFLSSTPYEPNSEVNDIQQSRLWKSFLGPDGVQFTSKASNLTFGMFIDAINPYVSIRYAHQNIFLAGIAPGPKEPSLEQINRILTPIVEQLKTLWCSGLRLSRTFQHINGQHIFCALLPFFADLPAARRSLGFAAPTATRMCSYCLLQRNEISNLDQNTWPPRTLPGHCYWATQSKNSQSLNARNKILCEHGVQYSVFLKLPYWDIVQYHVVDPMHNLLLGLLKWHVNQFWRMDNTLDEMDPQGISTQELMDLLGDAASGSNGATSNIALPSPTHSGQPFLDLDFNTTNDSNDGTFRTTISNYGWDCPWAAPSRGKIILDSQLLLYVNKMLPRIHVPTTIKRAPPILGKASHGRLKADELRHLFTIQLPLTLPVYWASGDPIKRSLFQNFAHLVSLVNIAMKRSITNNLISQYRTHINAYLSSSLFLFPDTPLAPNHHMAVHLADCLEKWGPSRAWWSFSMERLMGSLVKASTNNQIGSLEIPLMKSFARKGNLHALLDSQVLPEASKPFLSTLKGLSTPFASAEHSSRASKSHSLDSRLLKALIERLNILFPQEPLTWISTDKWCKKCPQEATRFLPVTSTIIGYNNYSINEATYSSCHQNPSNSIVALKGNAPCHVGIISQIFKHVCHLQDKSICSDMWLVITPLVSLPNSIANPFAHLNTYCLGLSLRVSDDKQQYVIHVDEVLAHCAWLKYKPHEVSNHLPFETYAVVLLNN